MARNPAIAVSEVEKVVVGAASPSVAGRATDWGAIIGGALGAMAVSIILFTAGSGFGLSTVEMVVRQSRTGTFAIGAAIWLIVMQWLSAAFGGYLAGRLRAKWIGPRTDEVLFRDTAHGLLAWALATLIVAALFTLGTLGTSAASCRDRRCTRRQCGCHAHRSGAKGRRKFLHRHGNIAASWCFRRRCGGRTRRIRSGCSLA